MSRSAKPRLEELFEQAFCDGYALHGDLGLEPEEFAGHLTAIAEKHLGRAVPRAVTLSFVDSLHTCDVYLAAACAQHSPSAWSRFMRLYQKYLKDSHLASRNSLPPGNQRKRT